ncbi:hypothetical protein C0995_009125 [Termitomyces sp. Mi166|nr:hypothetical protein C0995_009125 [Termitomyces sp. Mi166\
MFIVQFKKEAYKTGWNYNALRFQLSEALPKHIHDVLQLMPKQPTYKSFKNLTQGNSWNPPVPCPPAQLQAAEAEKIAKPCQSGCNGKDGQGHDTENPDLEEGKEHLQDCPEQNALDHAIWVINGDKYDFQYAENKTGLQTLINSGATGTFVSSELALSGKKISEVIELQLFDGTLATFGLITHHHSNVISLTNGLKFPVDLLVTQLHCTMPIILGLLWLHDANPDTDWKSMTITFETRDAQLAASFSLKSRPALTIKEVTNEDCPEPTNSESIHQPILVDLKEEKSVSTPNPLSPQANPTPSHATPSEQTPQPGDDTAQPQTDVIPLPTPPLTCPKPNIASPKYHPHFSLLPYSFLPNVSWNGFKGPH